MTCTKFSIATDAMVVASMIPDTLVLICTGKCSWLWCVKSLGLQIRRICFTFLFIVSMAVLAAYGALCQETRRS